MDRSLIGPTRNLVFHGIKGGPLNYRAFRRRVWLPTVRTLRLALRVHDLRHAFASLLLSWGENPVYVAAQMGHGNADVTPKVYGHLMREAQRLEEADTLRKIEEAYACQAGAKHAGERRFEETVKTNVLAGRGGGI